MMKKLLTACTVIAAAACALVYVLPQSCLEREQPAIRQYAAKAAAQFQNAERIEMIGTPHLETGRSTPVRLTYSVPVRTDAIFEPDFLVYVTLTPDVDAANKKLGWKAERISLYAEGEGAGWIRSEEY